MSSITVFIILAVYLAFLFGVAHWAERKNNLKWANNPYVYTLSLAVYCTAWTYYGSIGVAANSGLEFLTIYLGPVLVAPAWIMILRKIIRISRINKVASIADFISLRYGNSRFLGAVVTVVCLSGILPYIALQLKAISETFHLITNTSASANIFEDSTTYVAIFLALFASYYGTRYVDASEKRKGVVTAVALESLLKLVFFIMVGCYISFFVFDGFDDIYKQASTLSYFKERNTIGGLEQGMNWFFLSIASLFAVFLLPRQFQMSVVENNRERHIKTALWLFPLYLFLFNVFVYPIAWGGNILFDGTNANADLYSLLIPKLFNQKTILILVFLGGFSAAISMIVVSSISLSTMLSNNLIIPYSYLDKLATENPEKTSRNIVVLRKIGIFSLIISSFLIYRFFVLDYSLVSIGLIAFVIIAQLAPAFFGALYWRRGSKLGAVWSIIVGFAICAFTLLIPYLIGINNSNSTFITNGLFNIELLKPFALFGLDYLSPVSHALFWSLMFNTITYFSVSVSFKGNYRERNYAEMYVDIEKYSTNHENAFVWKGTAYTKDIEKVLNQFLGKERTIRALNIFNTKYNVASDQELADARLVKFAENLLTGHIGTASAKILIASVVKEEKVTLPEVLKILEESKETILLNKRLTETSKELKITSDKLQEANSFLRIKDQQKDEFLDTVTHELRTPITAIRAASEILKDDNDIPEELKQQFLNNIIVESDRLNRLIDKILDLEKFETGKQSLNIQKHNIVKTIDVTIENLQHLIKNKGIVVCFDAQGLLIGNFDNERILQVTTNILSNAIKFCPEVGGKITISLTKTTNEIQVQITDNGKGIENGESEIIFDKFYQSSNQTIKKPVGTGLGLAICKQIIEHHNGKIWAQNEKDNATSFYFTLPLNH